jgi:hypothetical protein
LPIRAPHLHVACVALACALPALACGSGSASARVDPTPTATARAKAPRIELTGHPRARTRGHTTTIPFWPHRHARHVTCRLDAGPVLPCRSPARLRSLAYGPHRLRVHAENAFGSVTLTVRFTVLRQPPAQTVSTPVDVSPPEFDPPG